MTAKISQTSRLTCMHQYMLQVSDDGRYVLLSIREGCDPVNRLWYCDLQTNPQGITGMVNLFSYLGLLLLFTLK